MSQRRMPKYQELRDLLQSQSSEGTRIERRMARAASIDDLRSLARRRAPRAVFDYVDGAADDEISLTRSRNLFREIEFAPNVLRDVSECNTTMSFLGVDAAMPFGFAPTGFTRMMHQEGESAVARVAEANNIPYALSTLGTTTPEVVAESVRNADLWFQLYVWRDRGLSKALVERAKASGFRVLVLTVDLPVGGARRRDVRNGMTLPPSLAWRTVAEGATHPRWWFDFLTTDPLVFSTLSSLEGTVSDTADKLFDPALNFDDVEWLVQQWDGPVVIKGIQTVDDARRVVDLGAQGVVLSNHGGRQLDRSPTPLRLISPTVDELSGDASVFIDGGIMNGADIVAAIALGASGCFVGRAYLYGIMAGGEAGVERVARILSDDIVRTMKLLGVTRLSDLHPGHVRLPRSIY